MVKHKILLIVVSLLIFASYFMPALAAEPTNLCIDYVCTNSGQGCATESDCGGVNTQGEGTTGGGGSGPSFPTQTTNSPPTQGLPTNLGQLIQQIFTWSLGILGISVFVMFFYSGFLWLTAAGNTSKIGEAKTHMTNAVFGAILLLSSYLILYTINPDFVKNTVNLPGLGTQK